MKIRGFVATAGIFLCLAGMAVFSSKVTAKEVTPIVNAFHSGLVGIMKEAKTLGVQGRFDALLPLVEGTFNMTLMAATATSPYWRAASKAEREALQDAFKRLSVATLATLFDGYNGENFKVVGERATGKRIRIVDTEITKADGGIVKLSYVGANAGGRWWIIDIIVDGGISEVKKRRNEFVALLKEGGLPRLTKELDDQTRALLARKQAK